MSREESRCTCCGSVVTDGRCNSCGHDPRAEKKAPRWSVTASLTLEQRVQRLEEASTGLWKRVGEAVKKAVAGASKSSSSK